MIKNILIVDDNDSTLESFKANLSRNNFKINYAKSGKEAINKIKLNKKPFNVAIVDIAMPDGDGFKVLNYIKNKSDNIPVIMITGFIDRGYYEKSITMGADWFFYKPLDFDMVTDAINRVIEHDRISLELMKTQNNIEKINKTLGIFSKWYLNNENEIKGLKNYLDSTKNELDKLIENSTKKELRKIKRFTKMLDEPATFEKYKSFEEIKKIHENVNLRLGEQDKRLQQLNDIVTSMIKGLVKGEIKITNISDIDSYLSSATNIKQEYYDLKDFRKDVTSKNIDNNEKDKILRKIDELEKTLMDKNLNKKRLKKITDWLNNHGYPISSLAMAIMNFLSK